MLSGHKNWVLCIAWSPDGKHLVSGSKAGELQCWDPQTGKPSGNPLIVPLKLQVGSSNLPTQGNKGFAFMAKGLQSFECILGDVSFHSLVVGWVSVGEEEEILEGDACVMWCLWREIFTSIALTSLEGSNTSPIKQIMELSRHRC
ncbi:hypothetical protein CsSME_00011606 [Camellia sinensis var. sinensis]